MHTKKNPRKKLENFSKIFMQLGLVLALFLTYLVIEQKTYERDFGELGDVLIIDHTETEPPIIKPREPEIPEQRPVIPDDPEVVDDDEDIVETIVDTTEGDETLEIMDVDDIIEADDPDPIVEDVDFILIEDAPVFPGCMTSV